MTEPWIADAAEFHAEIDAELNARLAPLGQALSPVFSNKPVIFHDGQGAYVPVVDDPERAHVFLYGTFKRPDSPRRTPTPHEPLPGHDFRADANLPTLEPYRQIEAQYLATDLRTLRGFPLAQKRGDCLALLVRPCRSGAADGEIDAELAADLLLHAATLLIGAPGSARHVRPMSRVRSFMAGVGEAANHKAGEAIQRFLRRDVLVRRAPERLPAILQTSNERAVLERDLRDLRMRLADVQETAAQRRTRLEDRRETRMRQVQRPDTDSLRAHMTAELAAIRALPQVISVQLDTSGRQPRLSVVLRAMTLTADGERRRATGTPVMTSMTIMLPLAASGEGSPSLIVRDLAGSRAPAPHVRQEACLGSISEPLRTCLSERQYMNAVQLVIGFLQSFDPEDSWGRAGRDWPGLEIAPGPGNVATLPLP